MILLPTWMHGQQLDDDELETWFAAQNRKPWTLWDYIGWGCAGICILMAVAAIVRAVVEAMR
jgi:hypothetical protein